ncbi:MULTISPECIES: hypothetical protein [unclassified Pseudomonas]|uniref:hypothetical protein n=1 Tax=Pseudomonas TaxID=286 RepID=UPI000C8858C5|nr:MULTISPECIES: hypothetical protein [unclassified Pseudomonas]PNA00074.1 hypothetical protein C1X79_06780 [Pseudomonas sp. FW305-42]PNA24267.1 hypothetical protein C1X78_11620 [Pseudomonas sp. MPR-R1B]PNB24941.1 hypothetical protein C1X80_15840 [Pseudomonas sp. DP16D-E2]PNB43003.1 hypothetical protein C1X75_13265 [Pseudomonas sp. FW305-17]PNB63339.1 hypothetical protein C1X77_06920 [Pseudomonas sp. GW531-E2]
MLLKRDPKFGFIRRARRELTYAFFLGTPPFLACASSQEVSELVNALLAAPALMSYYLWLLFAFGLVSIFIFRVTFRAYRLIQKSREVHSFFVNIGGSLLTAFRAALGAMMGYLMVWCYRDVESMSVAGTAGVLGYACIALAVCVWLAWTDETLRNPHAVSRYS